MGNFFTHANPKLATQAAPFEFGYSGDEGPLNWFHMNKTANKACSNGKNQSPINLNSSKLDILPVSSAPYFNVRWSTELLLNGSIVMNGVEYELLELHFHTPSEHFILDAYYPLEARFVFLSKSGGLAHRNTSSASYPSQPLAAVMTFHFETTLSETEPVFHNIFHSISDIPSPGNLTNTGPLDFSDAIAFFLSHKIYKYMGSLMTPPCTEGIQFLISDRRLNISSDDLRTVRLVQGFDTRNVQGLLGQENLIVQAARALQDARDF
ncbi:hypothetical protein GYMLUDRAFT_97157 [Collybiopsis luxurians FD-317 M1]|uniref:carbonic anhydrase n=1 Tax=Collybiopsis luxurians FD-317 M1 TaxID=944289 RepID=A0A0D0CD47_9AGAR|nr:hypothetical protein GYMLUDRAFT_97157 [Collybiopsis luxurians FD-317 M1]